MKIKLRLNLKKGAGRIRPLFFIFSAFSFSLAWLSFYRPFCRRNVPASCCPFFDYSARRGVALYVQTLLTLWRVISTNHPPIGRGALPVSCHHPDPSPANSSLYVGSWRWC